MENRSTTSKKLPSTIPTRNGTRIKRETGMGLRKLPKKLSAIDWEFERAKVTKKRTRAAKKIVLKKFRISYHSSLKLQILCILYNFLPLVKLFLSLRLEMVAPQRSQKEKFFDRIDGINWIKKNSKPPTWNCCPIYPVHPV
jgi:hypothetical protein